jgi:hypothetical protein
VNWLSELADEIADEIAAKIACSQYGHAQTAMEEGHRIGLASGIRMREDSVEERSVGSATCRKTRHHPNYVML